MSSEVASGILDATWRTAPRSFRWGFGNKSRPEARETARWLVQTQGIFGGTSSGLNVVRALQLAHELGIGHRVTCDTGLKHSQGDLYGDLYEV